MSSHSDPRRARLRHHRRYTLFSAARNVSSAGDGFGPIALSFGVLASPHGSASLLSLVLFCQLLPAIVMMLVGGVVGDRFSARAVLSLARVGSAAGYGALALVLGSHADAPWALCVAATFTGASQAMFLPASQKVVPALVPDELLRAANASLRLGFNLARIVGMSAAGLVVHYLGADVSLGINSASFVIESAVLAAVLPGGIATTSRKSFTGDLRRGWREFSSRQWLWAVVLQYTVVIAATNALTGILGPLAAGSYLGGSAAWGFATAAQAAGRVAGAGFSLRVKPHRPILVGVLATCPAALPLFVLAARWDLALLIVAFFASGFFADIFNVLWSTTMQREVPRESLSMVNSYDLLGSIAMAPIGLLVAGPAAASFGVGPVLWAGGVLVVGATGAVALAPGVRHLTDVSDTSAAVRTDALAGSTKGKVISS